MGKLDIESSIAEAEDFDADQDADSISDKITAMSKDSRRRLEDRLDEVRLNRQLREYDFRDI